MGRLEIVMKAIDKAMRINRDGTLEMRRVWDRNPSGFIELFEDFKGTTIPDETGTLSSGTSSAVAVEEGYKGGAVRLTTGTDDDGHAAICDQLGWYGDDNLWMEAIVKLPAAITTYKLEVGVTDAIDDVGAWTNDSLLENGSGNTALNCAIFIFDADKDTGLYIAGAKDNTGWGGIDTGVTLAGGETHAFRIRIIGDNAYFYHKQIGAGLSQAWTKVGEKIGALAIEGGAVLTPWVFTQSLTGAATRLTDVDYIKAIQDRA